uniref:Uncharacterized protein n=1 Tax=Panagrolaimus sp. ES5 TaxID=591445 RepID=A0AC34F5P2_9BILA
MFQNLFFIFICFIFIQISNGITCRVAYTGFGESEIPLNELPNNKCDPKITSCVSANITINGNNLTVSDCKNTAEIILTNYLQGQQGYKNEISFDCSSIEPIVSFNDTTITYSYKCENFVDAHPTIPTSTEKGDASTLSCFLSTIILSIVYVAFK